jgi:uncharacterized membrane protein YgcG
MPRRSRAEPAPLRSALAIASLAALLASAGCSSTVGFDDPFADYLQRTPLVSTIGGDAQAANLAMQTATPWPRVANDTNIPANGARLVKVITRYESGASGAGASDSSSQTSTSSGGNSSGGGATNGAASGMTASPSPQP